MAEERTTSSPLLVAAAWAVVVLPALWGLSYTVQNAAKIFTRPAPSAAPAPSSSASPGSSSSASAAPK